MALCYLQQIRKLKQLLKRIGRDTNPFLHFLGERRTALHSKWDTNDLVFDCCLSWGYLHCVVNK